MRMARYFLFCVRTPCEGLAPLTENYVQTDEHIREEYPWDPAADPQKFHIIASNPVVSIGLSLPMTAVEFDLFKQDALREAIAQVAHVSVYDVTIDKIEAVSDEINVMLDVRAQDQEMDDAIEAALTGDAINIRLTHAGLPAAAVIDEHKTRMNHRVDCENGHLSEDCYKHRYHPPEPTADAQTREYTKSPPKEAAVPVGPGPGNAETDLPPDEIGKDVPVEPHEKLPPGERSSGTAPRPKDDIGDSPFEPGDSAGVETERGEGEFEQPVGAPEAIEGVPPESRKGTPPEGRQGGVPEARGHTQAEGREQTPPTATPTEGPDGVKPTPAAGVGNKPADAIRGGTPAPNTPPNPPPVTPYFPAEDQPYAPEPYQAPPPPSPPPSPPTPPPPTPPPPPSRKPPPEKEVGKGKFIWWVPAREARPTLPPKSPWPTPADEASAHAPSDSSASICDEPWIHLDGEAFQRRSSVEAGDASATPPRGAGTPLRQHDIRPGSVRCLERRALAAHTHSGDAVLEDFASSILGEPAKALWQSQGVSQGSGKTGRPIRTRKKMQRQGASSAFSSRGRHHTEGETPQKLPFRR